MKNKIKIIITILAFLVFPFSANALSVTCSGPGTVTVGQTFTVTISASSDIDTYWNGNAVNYSSNLKSNFGSGSYVEAGASRGVSKTYSFTALSVGNATINQTVSYANQSTDYNDRSQTSSTCNINIVAATSNNSSNNNSGKTQANVSNAVKKKPDPNKSSNNNLKSITIDGVELVPEFNKDTLEYSSTVEGNVEKITINAEVEDGKSYIEGLGEKELQEGLNEFTLVVTAENGNIKEYKISISRKEKNPIEVVINGKKYTVVKKESDLEIPEGFERKTITIKDEEVVAYENKYTNKIIVVLVDEDGDPGFFSYDEKNNKYTRYIELISNQIKLMLIDPNDDIPFKYKKVTFTIDGQKIDGYYYKAKSKFRLVYAINLETGEEGFYQYDMDQKTFQRFYNDQVEEYTVYGKYIMYGAIGVAGLLLILFISVIVLSSKNRKLKKKLKNNIAPKKEVKEEVKEVPKTLTRAERLKLKEQEAPKKEVEEKTTVLELDKTKELTSREQKRLEKEKQKKLKEEANEFLK